MCPTYTSAVLDPRITYEGLKLDFANDPGLLTDLERSKELLEEFYDNNYAASPVHSENFDNSHPIDSHMSDFTSHYSSIDAEVVNELEILQDQAQGFQEMQSTQVAEKPT